MSQTSEGLRITIRGRVKPVSAHGSLRDIRLACDQVIKNSGLDPRAVMLRPDGKPGAGHRQTR